RAGASPLHGELPVRALRAKEVEHLRVDEGAVRRDLVTLEGEVARVPVEAGRDAEGPLEPHRVDGLEDDARGAAMHRDPVERGADERRPGTRVVAAELPREPPRPKP